MRRMFGHVGRRTAILTTQRQALQQAQDDQNDRGDNANLVRCGQNTNHEGGSTHDEDGNKEGIFASNQIPQAAEEQGAEGAHQEAGGKGDQREDIARGFRELAEEVGADNGRQRPVKIEIIPFENRAER